MIRSGRHAELERTTRALVERFPDSGIAWKALGVSLTLQGKDALAPLQRAATLLPEDPEAHANLGNAWLNLARFRDAAASYARALEIKPDYPEACNNLGNAQRALGRLDDALASYAQALRIRPDFAEAHSNLGNALRGLGRLDDAAASYRRALEIRPRYPEAWNNLGNAMLDLERFEEAAASYGRALELNPGFAEAHSNLGNALRGLGRLDEAAASYRRALALDPGFAGAHSNLGDALRELGQPAAAVSSCRRALEIQPQFAGAHNSLGNALMDLGEAGQAAASYRRALILRSDFTEARVNLGLALRQSGDAAEAEASCHGALAMNPAAAPALVLLGELRADEGRFEEAEELFRRAAAADPTLPEAWAGIAYLRKMTLRDAAWAAQAQQIAEHRPVPRREVYLRFAIGKYFDDIGDYGNAFRNYRRAHELIRLHATPYDRTQLTRTVDRTIRSYKVARRARISSGSAATTRPVFVVGMPRSGTTLAEQILASHPAVFGAGELNFWPGAAPAFLIDPQSADPQSVDVESADLALGRAREAAADYLRLLQDLSSDALRVVDKMPANFMHLGPIHEALPGARIIHMQRNPIDTCLSIYCQHFKNAYAYAHDLEDLAHYYTEYLRLMSHWKFVLPAEAILDVPYEGLVDDQEGWSRRMVDHIGIPWDARCMEFHRTRRSVMTASKWQVRQKMSRSSVDRWRNYQEFLGPLLDLGRAAHPAAAVSPPVIPMRGD